jgi:glycine/D-amino acid oxidase-like deaminating enzyme/nitrite reductase/ring-hydroxylating ferredoxin subunit
MTEPIGAEVATTSARRSLWFDDLNRIDYPRVDHDETVDVAVVGGGLAGLTTALLLKRDGARVAVVEASRVGAGVTGCTTAKVSALQATTYTTVSRRHGAEKAAVYGAASLAGVDLLAHTVESEGIECDLDRRPACTYAATDDDLAAVQREAEAAKQAGLPVEYVESPSTAYPARAAVRLADQIQLHPVRYVQGLAAAVHGGGSHVFENTRAVTVSDGSPCRVVTETGVVLARQVVIATHYPILDRGAYFARLEPQRSYCIAARLSHGDLPREMSISAGSPTRSIRSHRDWLIVGGEGHPAGSPSATADRFETLEAFAREHWDIGAVSHRWSAQDPQSYDHLPMIGSYLPRSTRLLVATGFMKWGLTSATFGARILADQIAGRDNEWADTFSPSRLSLRSAPDVARLGARFSGDFVMDRLKPADVGSPDEVPAGEARVVRDGRKKVGVYRDRDGAAHAVSLRCTHLGCLLRFNAAETSWDCPCHGSRFDVDGGVLEGPATRPLQQPDV